MSIIVVENVFIVFRLRSVSESGRSPGSTGSPGSSGDWSTLEARNFSRTSSGIFCRICHDADGAEALISPCQCSGEERRVFISPCQCRGEGRGVGEGVEALISPCQCSGEGVGGMKKGGGV